MMDTASEEQNTVRIFNVAFSRDERGSSHLDDEAWDAIIKILKGVSMDLQSKSVVDLRRDIKKLMFNSDNIPAVVVEDQQRFTMIMAAFHNYERVAKRDSNHSDMNDVIKKLHTHMDVLFTVDLPFYIFLIYRMQKKHIYYSCDEMRAMIMAVIARMENEDRRAVVQAMTRFMERGDFKIMYNPDEIEDRQVSIFHQLEQTCLELADLSYKIQISDVCNVGELPNGMKPVYKNFVYSRMLWISLAMRLHERHTGQATRKVLEVWVTKLVSYHQRVELTSEAIKELEAGLEVGQLLKLSPIFAFNQAQLTDFIAMHYDRTLRPFAQIMECFKMLKKFMISSYDVIVLLVNLRSVYADYLAAPVLPFKIKSVSCEGTLNDCITEGIEFLDMVLEWLGEMEVSKEVKDAELQSWLRLLLQLVDITGDNPVQYLKYFISGREKIIKKYKLVAQNHIVTATQNSFGRLSIQQFCILYKSFKIYSNNIVKEFLIKYSIPATITLSDPTWKEFFGAVVVRSQSAYSHQYLAEFMIHCSFKYRDSGRAVAFVTDLLKLDVEKLLSVSSEEDRESQEVRAKFSLFLKDFINRNALIDGILDHIVVILMSMTNNNNEFQRLVLDVLKREIMTDLRTLQGKEQNNNFKNLMSEIVMVLTNDLTWLCGLSTKQHFFWGILGTCVSKIAVKKDTFDWVHNYSDIISKFELGVVYSCFCTYQKLSSEERVIIEGLPAAVKLHPSDDLRRYFEWIGTIQSVLQHWKKKFQHHEVTYDEVINYASSHVRFLPLGESVGTPHLVVESALIVSAKTTFLEKFELLNAHLLKYIPGQSEGKWCMLPSLLETYGVVLPQAAQDFIVKKVAFPGEALIPQKQLGTPLHPNTTGLFKPGLKISLRLHKTVTLRELGKVMRDLDPFQEPLLDHLQMLVFFKLHKSSLFDKYLRHFLKKIAEELQEPQELVSLTSFQDIHFSIPPPSLARNNSQTMPRDNLVRGLVSTQDLIKKIIFGTATYFEIVAEDEGMLKGLDMEQEFAILHEYGQYNHLTGATCEGLDGVRNLLELFQYTTHINNIRSVCDHYSTLKGCSDGSNLMELYTTIENHVWVEDPTQLKPLEAKEKIKHMKEVFFSSKCLEIFADMADSIKDRETCRNHSRNIEVTNYRVQEKAAHILAEKEIKIQQLSGIILEKESNFCQLLAEKEVEIEKLSGTICEKDASFQQLIKDKEAEIKKLSGTVQDTLEMSDYIQKSLIDKESEIEKLLGTIHEQDAYIQQCLTEKEAEIEKLSRNLQEKRDTAEQKSVVIEKLSKKLKTYEELYDESWLEITKRSESSWKIERFKINTIPQKKVGVGSWGVVNSGHFRGECVAFKYVHEQLFLQYPGIVDLIKREVSIMAHIQHPNLVRFIGAVLDEDVEAKRDVPIIVLELMDMNLRTAYSMERIDRPAALSIFCDIAYALHYLHEQLSPMIHRDVSSPNVLLKRLPNQSFKAKISDFGSANLVKLSRTAGAGAIIYTAPEMFPQDITVEPPEQTVKVDVFSYGIVLLEVVNEKMPEIEKRTLLLQTCKSKWKEIFDLIIWCTKRAPEDRPTMREILNSLHQISVIV